MRAHFLTATLLPVIVFGQSERCAPCHPKVVETYRQTAMGRSFYRPSLANVALGTYFHEPSASYFTMLRRDGGFFQRRYQLDAAGKPINVFEKQIDYVMGSGNHSRAYLYRTPTGTLFELPLAWYAEKGGYLAMNPGYDRPDHAGFRRPITYDCMFCHNAYPQVQGAGQYVGELPEGIDCQRCHGDGTQHIKRGGRGSIVNPARLTPDRQLEGCMVCHLETTSFPLPNALQRYERGPFSYKPGESLGDFILNFDHAPNTGRDDKFELVNAAYRLRRSACYLKGKVKCTTCHNPHDASPKDYTKICQGCHAVIARANHTSDTNCVTCHMPTRRTEDVVHVTATDHFIQRFKPAGDLQATLKERKESYRGPVVLYYPEKLPKTAENELYLALAQVKQGSNLTAGIAQLTGALARYAPRRAEWYIELAEALDSNREWARALPMYRKAAQLDPPLGMPKLGAALRRSGSPGEAVQVLIKVKPSAVTWNDLGLAYQALGQSAQAVGALGQAIALDSELPEAHNNLGSVWLARGDTAHAEPAFREAIRIRPDYADAHANLASLLSSTGKLPEAQQEFQWALRYKPSDAATRYSYAVLLGRANRYDEARRELEASLTADPQFLDAHLLLADLLMARQQVAAARPHYQEALRLKSESARAHLGLAAVLLATGDREGAVPHLKAAAGGTDATVREQALEILRQLGR